MIPYLAILAALASPALAGGYRYPFQADGNLCMGLNPDGALGLKVTECNSAEDFHIEIGETNIKIYQDGHEKCLDGSNTEGSQPHFRDCNGSANQKFWFTNDGRLALMDQGLCIDPEGFHVEAGKPLVLNRCRDGQASQALTRGQTGDVVISVVTGPEKTAHDYALAKGGPWKIFSKIDAAMCIDEYNEWAELRPCDYKDTNPWTMHAGATLVQHGNRCLTAYTEEDGHARDGSLLYVSDCIDVNSDTAWTQSFWWSDDGRLSLRDTGLCVDVPEAIAVPGAQLQLWTCGDGVAEQGFMLEQAELPAAGGDGKEDIVTVGDQRVVDGAYHTNKAAAKAPPTAADHADMCPHGIHPGHWNSHCLDSTLTVTECRNRNGWTGTDGETELRIGGQCLTTEFANPKSNSLGVLPCDGRPEQLFTVTTDRIMNNGRCLEYTRKNGGLEGAKVAMTPCSADNENQIWSSSKTQANCVDAPERRWRIENTKGRRMTFG